MKLEDLKIMLAKPGCRASNLALAKQLLYEPETDCILHCPEPQRDQAKPLGKAVPGEAEGPPRVVVRFVGYRCRPLDPDNFAGGCKDLLDGLRHAGLIGGDEYWRITLITEQVKVSRRSEERTLISITSSSEDGR